jgi:hypothetical protein
VEGDSIRCVTLKKIYKKRRKHNLGERIGGCIVKIKEKKMNSVSLVSRQHVRKKKNKIRKTKEKECTTLASGLGVVQICEIFFLNYVSVS